MKRIDFKLNNIPLIKDEISLSLGYFDGLHIGHLSLLNESKKSKYKTALLTFNMDNIILKRNNFLTSLLDREEILSKLGVDYMFVLNFDEEVMKLSSTEFIEKILFPLNVKEVVLGNDYTFGYKKSGNKETLINYENRPYEVKVIDDVILDNNKISTTFLIKCLSNGQVDLVNKYLNRNYRVKGLVEKGLSNGKTISYPTANIKLIGNYVLPKNGVYFTYIYIDEKKYKSMSNIGIHPTISPLEKPILETHIFDYNSDLYDDEVEVEFISYIRDEETFSSLDDLKKQLQIDEAYIRAIKI